MRKLFAITFFISLGLSACSNCKNPGTMRCQGNRVQICTSDGRWKTTRDCNDFEKTECKKIDGKDIRTCIKKENIE